MSQSITGGKVADETMTMKKNDADASSSTKNASEATKGEEAKPTAEPFKKEIVQSSEVKKMASDVNKTKEEVKNGVQSSGSAMLESEVSETADLNPAYEKPSDPASLGDDAVLNVVPNANPLLLSSTSANNVPQIPVIHEQEVSKVSLASSSTKNMI